MMDEPTAALTAAEVDRLFRVMREIAARGVGIVYISHRLEEVPRVADRVTVLRDGQVAGVAPAEAPQSELVRMLVGRPLDRALSAARRPISASRCCGSNAPVSRRVARGPGWQAPVDVSLVVRAGEIVGLAGIMGAGRTELLSALYGAAGRGDGRASSRSRAAGAPRLDPRSAGRGARPRHRRPARQRALLRDTVGRNLVADGARARLAVLPDVARGRAPLARGAIQHFDVRPPRPESSVGALSGGNQQKVVLAKEVLGEPAPAPARRADARGRRRRQGRDLRPDPRARRAGARRADRFERDAGAARPCDRVVVLRAAGRSRNSRAAPTSTTCWRRPRRARKHERMNEAAPVARPPIRRRCAAASISSPSRSGFRASSASSLVAIGGIIFSPRRHGHILFLAPDNIANIVRAVSETGIIAVGMTFVIITAGIDLSVGALLSLCSVLTATIMTTGGWGLIPTVLFVVVCGAAFGAVQGLISTRFRLEPFIVTLAGLQVARGLALVISSNQYINISYGDGPGLAPPVFAILGDRLFDNSCRSRRWSSWSSRPSRPSCSTSPASAATSSRSAVTSARPGFPACRSRRSRSRSTRSPASSRRSPASSTPGSSTSAAPTTAPATN